MTEQAVPGAPVAGSVYTDASPRYQWPVSPFERIRRNTRNSYLAFAAFLTVDVLSFGFYGTALTMVLMGLFGYLRRGSGTAELLGAMSLALNYGFPAGAVLGLVVALIGGMLAFLRSGDQYLNMVGAHEVTEQITDGRLVGLRRAAENMAIAAQLPAPKTYVMESPSLNAFAVGNAKGEGHVVVTSALLLNLEPAELEGVVAHEMSHVNNRDSRLLAVVICLAAVPLLLPSFAGRGFYWGGGGRSGSRDSNGGNLVLILVGVALWAVTYLVAKLATAVLRAFASQEREFLADATAARLTRNPRALAEALRKIDLMDGQAQPLPARFDRLEALFIATPMGKGNRLRSHTLFGTHPPTEERIKRLMAM